MKAIEECKTVAELLESPERWGRYASARSADGSHVPPGSPKAACFCLFGAMERIYGNGTDFHEVRQKMLRVTGWQSIVDWNDHCHRTHAEVLAAVRAAGI